MSQVFIPKILIVGCGDLGGTIAMQLASIGLDAIGVSRTVKPCAGVEILQADVTVPASLSLLQTIKPTILLYCVAADGQTDAAYKAQYVDGLRHVLATQSDNPHLKHVFFVSSTRVYGQQTDALLDETSVASPNDFGGERLLEAEHLLKNLACTTSILRLSGIYGPGRLRMIQLAKTPERWPAQNGWSNRIHRDDAAAFIVYLVQMVLANKPVNACYIVTDSTPTTQYEVLIWLAAQLNIQTYTEALPMQIPDISGGKRLSNQAMLSSGFQLQYPDYRTGYLTLLANT